MSNDSDIGFCRSCGNALSTSGCLNYRCPSRSAVSVPGFSPQFEVNNDGAHALHPTGSCTCGGEGSCEWCQGICARCGGTGREPTVPTGVKLAEAVRKFVRAKEEHDDETAGQTYYHMIDLANAINGT